MAIPAISTINMSSGTVMVALSEQVAPAALSLGGWGRCWGRALWGRAAAGYSRRPLWTISQLHMSLVLPAVLASEPTEAAARLRRL
jgi:hypothetical protein